MNQQRAISFEHILISFFSYFLNSYKAFHFLTTLIITGVIIYENNNR